MVKAYRNIRIKKENRMAGEREAEGKKWNAPKLLPVHKLWRITIFYIIFLSLYVPYQSDISSTETSLTFVPVGPVIISPSVSFKAL